jgi:NADPH:quinone reductase-like Zn-dependent oxidoreductase
MYAIVRTRYGAPEVMRVGDVPKPDVIADDGMLVRVRATSINAHDWHMLRGEPYFARLSEGLRRPKQAVLGLDVAGVVEAVGKDVTHVRPGDRVFGSRWGAFAEYVSGRIFLPMPEHLSFEEAAALPVAGFTALQGLRDRGGLQPGQRVLIVGAGGGVGTAAVQIAKALGGEVTAASRAGNHDRLCALGADHVLDHSEDPGRGTARFDLIFDIGGRRSLGSLARAMTPDGTLVMAAPNPGLWIGPVARVLVGVVRSKVGRRRFVPFLSSGSRDDLLVIKELVDAGKLRPVIERSYELREVPDAIRRLEAGGVFGKLVITV